MLRKQYQSLVLKQLLAHDRYSTEALLRRKLERWRIKGVPEGTLTRRATQILSWAFDMTSPRIAGVLFRSWLNGWCTARRFQSRASTCLLGCNLPSPDCEDSIEHYAHCRIVRCFASEVLRLPAQLVGNLQGLLCLHAGVSDDIRVLQLLLLYAIYTATNIIRRNAAPQQVQSVRELLLQLMHQGASPSSNSQRVLRYTLSYRPARRRRNA